MVTFVSLPSCHPIVEHKDEIGMIIVYNTHIDNVLMKTAAPLLTALKLVPESKEEELVCLLLVDPPKSLAFCFSGTTCIATL